MIYILMFLFLMVDKPSLAMDSQPCEGEGRNDSLNVRIRNSDQGQKTFNKELSKEAESAFKKVAIIDTGFYLEHERFEKRWDVGYNALDGSTHVGLYSKNYKETPGEEVSSGRTHGTHMASLVAEVSQECPQIKIVPIKVGMEPLADIDLHVRALNYIAQRSDIAVVSIAVNYPIIFHAEPDTLPVLKEALLRVIDSGKLIVIAGLNDGRPYIKESQFAQFVLSHEAKGRIIVAGASKQHCKGDEIIASFSNRAGTLAPHFIVAAGDDLKCATYTSVLDISKRQQSYERASGSSHATAVVAGSLIYLINQFKGLSIDDFPKIIFESASKKPEFFPLKRSRKIYGHGVLDLDNARLLASTMLVHKRIDSKPLMLSSSPFSHLRTRGEKRPPSYLVSPWGQWCSFEEKKENLSKKWVSDGLFTKVIDGKETKSPMVIHIPESMQPDTLFGSDIAKKPVKVFYAPTPVSKKFRTSQEGEEEKGFDGHATSYTLLLNKEGKMIYVRKGLK